MRSALLIVASKNMKKSISSGKDKMIFCEHIQISRNRGSRLQVLYKITALKHSQNL